MTTSYAYTPSLWPSLFSVLLLVALTGYGSQRRRVPAATPLMIASLFASIWSAGSVMEYAAAGLETKLGWVKFQGIWQIPTISAIICFTLEYTWPGRWLSRRNLALLAIPALLSIFLVLTNDYHHLAWRSFRFNGSVQPQFGLLGWIFSAYGLGVLGIINFGVFGWLFYRSPQHRWPVALLLAGQFGGRLLYLLERVDLLRSTLPLDVLGMSFEFLIYAIVLFGFRILDPIPLAHQMAIEQLQAGVLIIDPGGRVVSLNAAAAAILGLARKSGLGRAIQDLLPADAGLVNGLQAPGTGRADISLQTGPVTREYQVERSSLTDWRGMVTGHLIFLHDVTEQKRAQAQILEQQRALAMLQEREQLARDLHDGLGQVLGYAGLQLEVVNDRIQDGQAALSAGQAGEARARLTEAGEQLARLSNIVRAAHADMRGFILDLRLAPSDQRPFFPALQQYLDGFSQNYGIQTEVSITPGAGDIQLDADEGLHLFRIIQEALSNARKHAGASCVQVSFEKHSALLQVCIQDNGGGFDPGRGGRAEAQSGPDNHFGLQFMRERAEQLGGLFTIESVLGQGTRIIVRIPQNHK